MIDHVSLGVGDLAASRAFYDAVLAPLGYRRRYDLDDASGYGASAPHPLKEQALPFWIGHEPAGAALSGHVCFTAPSRAAVDAFHAAALAAGGTDEGPPGIREHYHPNYYGAYVRDADGNKICVVCHQAVAAAAA